MYVIRIFSIQVCVGFRVVSDFATPTPRYHPLGLEFNVYNCGISQPKFKKFISSTYIS